MKKCLLIFMTLIFVLTLSSCNNEIIPVSLNEKFNIETLPEEINLEKQYRMINVNKEYETYTISDNEKIEEFINNLNKIEFKKNNALSHTPLSYLYMITYDDVKICLISSTYFYLIKGNDTVQYKIVEGSLDFIYEIPFTKTDKYHEQDFSKYNLDTRMFIREEKTGKIAVFIEKDVFLTGLQKIKYAEALEEPENNVPRFTIILDGEEIGLLDGYNITYGGEFYTTINSSFDFVYALTEKDGLHLSYDFLKYNTLSTIVVKDVVNDKTKIITEKESFLASLQQIKYYKLSTPPTNREAIYILDIENNEISIIDDNTLYYNSAYFRTYEKDFSFLKEINFNGTGWLPWL